MWSQDSLETWCLPQGAASGVVAQPWDAFAVISVRSCEAGKVSSLGLVNAL